MPDRSNEKPLGFLTHNIDAWRVFRILAEFVEGFESMLSIGPSVSFFGSSCIKSSDPYYNLSVLLAAKISKKGFAVITGGGSGLMEAANEGARAAGGPSCGLCIDLPSEGDPNPFIDRKFLLRFRYFFVRKVMFVRYAQAFVVLPGGYGTLNELFEALTLIQTKKIKPFPVYLVGKDYWAGLIDWIKMSMEKHHILTKEDLDMLIVTDDLDQIVTGIEDHYRRTKSVENF